MLNYANNVRDQECVLVLLKDAAGTAVAVGQYSLTKAERGWVEIKEKYNASPSVQVREDFEAYSDTIRQFVLLGSFDKQ